MTNNYQISDILEAVDTLLERSSSKVEPKNKKDVLVLTNTMEDLKKREDRIPKETEQIILEAEKYLKK
tara:strand:+ start:376 stop:579 length:204 start_codon:yes stop_codon:yes gene_type:complete